MGLAPIALALLLAPADVTFHAAAPGGFGDVLVVDESGTAAPRRPFALRQTRLLDLEAAGDHPVTRWLAGRARPVADVGPGASRLVLPEGRGSLYRFERRDPLVRGVRFGFFVVDGQGRPRVVRERVGTGAGAATDPFLPAVGVRADGRAALVATTPAAGGDLFEVDLDAGTAVNRTPDLPPLDVRGDGLALLAGWGLAVTDLGVVRFQSTTGATASLVDLGAPAPTFFPGPLAASDDGSTVAVLAGASPSSCDVHVLGAVGGSMRVTATPGALGGAGLGPAFDNGPYLALSPDGSACAWTTVGVARELFVRRVALSAPAPVQVSADANFLDTLDEISSIRFVTPDTVMFLLGGLEQPEGTVENGDFFEASIDAVTGNVTITNLSLTSGDATAPFTTPGTVKSEGGIFALDGFPGFFLHDDQSSNSGALRSVRAGVPGFATVLADVATLEAFSVSGPDACVLVERNLPGDPRELWSLDLAGAPLAQFLGSFPLGSALVTLQPDGASRFAYQRAQPLGLRIGRIDAAAGSVEELLAPALPLVETLAWSPTGALVTTANAGGAGYAALWPTAGTPVLLGSADGGLRVLPGP